MKHAIHLIKHKHRSRKSNKAKNEWGCQSHKKRLLNYTMIIFNFSFGFL